jgi:hypothetical protein
MSRTAATTASNVAWSALRFQGLSTIHVEESFDAALFTI